MARDEQDQGYVGKCPVCLQKLNDKARGLVGLHDWRELNKHLPGRVGASDVDTVLQHEASDRILLIEYKGRAAPLSTGQRIMYKAFIRRDVEVWVVVDSKIHTTGEVLVAKVDEKGTLKHPGTGDGADPWAVLTVEGFYEKVAQWWAAGGRKAA